MKKLQILSLLALLTMSTVQPANAGLAIGAISGNSGSGMKIGAFIGFGVGVASGFGISAFGDALNCKEFNLGAGASTGLIGGVIGGIAGGLLDVNASVSSEALVHGFKNQYPFINNAEALRNLAELAKSKFATGSSVVTFTSAEVLEVLSGTQITPEQFSQIANDLK